MMREKGATGISKSCDYPPSRTALRHVCLSWSELKCDKPVSLFCLCRIIASKATLAHTSHTLLGFQAHHSGPFLRLLNVKRRQYQTSLFKSCTQRNSGSVWIVCSGPLPRTNQSTNQHAAGGFFIDSNSYFAAQIHTNAWFLKGVTEIQHK